MREDWITCTLGELLTLKNGFAFKSSNYISEGIPVIRIGDINDWIVDETQAKCVVENKEYDGYIVEKGDILIAMSGATTGKFGVYESDSKAYQNQRVGNLKPSSKDFIDKKYIFNLLYSLKYEIKKGAYGGAQPNISAGKIHALNTVLAPLPEQRAIVSKIEELFSDLDKGITDLKKAQDQLVVYRQAVLKKAFEGELTKVWREQQTDLPTAEELLEQIKEERQKHYEQQLENWKQELKAWEENGKEGKKPTKPKKLIEISNLTKEELDKLDSLPIEWLYSYLAFAGELARGKSKHRPRNDSKLFENGKYPFIQTGDVKAQKIITDFNKKYSEFGLQQSKLWKKGTLCITIAANIAETGFLGIDACFPDSIVGFTPFNEIIENHFIEYFFQLAKTRISAYAPATAQKNINLTILENLVVPFCSKKEQNKIVQEIESRLSVCDKVEESIKESLEKAKALRQSILKKAFEGTLLSVEEIAACKAAPDYEPASFLLKKIKAEKKK